LTKQCIGKVALITGGGSGIGRAVAMRFASLGAAVVIADSTPASGSETARQIQSNGGSALFIETDVTQAAQVDSCMTRLMQEYGRLDFAHNNAGVEGELTLTADSSEVNWDRTIAVNLKGVWLCMRAEIKEMLKQAGGAIVNTSSVAGLVGQPAAAAYCASKHGVIGLTRAAALEYIRNGIRINAVCPGLVQTAMTERIAATDRKLLAALATASPIGRPARAEEIATVVTWLCSDDASYIVGQALPVDGAVTVQ